MRVIAVLALTGKGGSTIMDSSEEYFSMEIKRRFACSAEEYLANEMESATKHEFVDGQVFAMTGATGRH